MSALKKASATGAAVTGPVRLYGVVLAGGTAASTVSVRDGAGGTDVLTLAAPIGGYASWHAANPHGELPGVPFATSVYVTLGGTGASCSLEYS
jgi:hypothetical protein